MPADPNDRSADHFRRPTQMLDALEASEPLTVPHWHLGKRAPRFLRRTGGWFRVDADDVVVPAECPTAPHRPEP